MLQPSDFMPTVRIMMRPVDNTAFRVPFVLTEKFNSIPAFSEPNRLRNITFTITGKHEVLIFSRAR
jgi:hypothetical protein